MATPSPPAAAVTSDRDALVALYEATDGANWTNSENWLSEQPLDEWWGVTTDGQGRVTNLVLWANQLHGALPPQLGDLAALEELNIGGAARVEGAAANIWWLHQNHLRGPIPPQLGLLSNLRVLDLSGEEGNSLTGPIPVELGNLANLERLLLKGNQLTGPIPPELGRLVNLEELRLGGSNQFTGCIPAGLQAVEENDLDKLGLPFCGASESSSDRAALVALYHAADGANWSNNRNWLSDAPLGEWHGVTTDRSGQVTELRLPQNQLSGPIPPELGSLANLEQLWLWNNQLTGEIPPELGNLANLKALGLNDNQLAGEIPAELSNLAMLGYLSISGNQLTGAIPVELSNLANLSVLQLSDNQLTGAIPPELGRLVNLEDLNLSSNQLTGAIPPELGRLARLGLWVTGPGHPSGGLDLSHNQLTGAIPPELGNLAHLAWLRLRENQISGAIPPELSRLRALQSLTLGGSNQLTGCIPKAVQELSLVPYLHDHDIDELGLPFCADAPAPAGESLRATVAPSAGLNVRAGPDPSAAIVYVAPGGSDLELSGGTQVVDGVTWWQLTDGHWVQGQFLKFG